MKWKSIVADHKINKRKKSLIIRELMQQDTGERRWQTLCDKRVTRVTTLSLSLNRSLYKDQKTPRYTKRRSWQNMQVIYHNSPFTFVEPIFFAFSPFYRAWCQAILMYFFLLSCCVMPSTEIKLFMSQTLFKLRPTQII